jgi:hypothetical protein
MSRIAVVLPALGLVSILFGAIAAPAVAAAGHKQPLECPPAHAKQITVDKQAVIYKAPGPPEDGEEGFPTLFACAFGHRRYMLGEPAEFGPEGGGGIARETLVGVMVAYEKSLIPAPNGHDSFVIYVRDLLTGRIVHEAPTAEAKFPGEVGKDSAEKIVLKRDGSVAWIDQTEPHEFQIRAVDKTGNRLLAVSGDIVPRSLSLKGSTLRWIEDGKPTYAILH